MYTKTKSAILALCLQFGKKESMMKMKSAFLFLFVLCMSLAPAYAQEAATAGSVEPENIAGTVGPDGLLDFGSPAVVQTLAAEHVFAVHYFSVDEQYGRIVEKPIMVGGGISDGPKNEQRFLNALAGPNGERVAYKRKGSTKPFITKHGLGGTGGMLDMYTVTYEGQKEPETLYINMYDSDTLKIPVGFRMKYAPRREPPAHEEAKQ